MAERNSAGHGAVTPVTGVSVDVRISSPDRVGRRWRVVRLWRRSWADDRPVRLTEYARGGGCACKIPPGELEEMVAGLGPADRHRRAAGRPGPRRRRRGGPAGRADRPGQPPPTSSPRSSTTPTTGGASPPPTPSPTCTPWAAPRWWRSTCSAGPADVLPLELAREVLRGGQDVAREAGCHLAGGHSVDDDGPKYGLAVTGAGPPRGADHPGRRAGRAAAVADQAARRRGAQHPAQGHRRAVPEAVAAMTTPQPGRGPRGGRRRHPLRHRRDRLRAARARLEAGPGQRGDGGDRRRPGALPAGRAGGGARRVRQRRQPAQPGVGDPVDRLRRGRTRTSGCCWPTRRPPAGCWWPARCPAAPVIGELLPRGEHLVVR